MKAVRKAALKRLIDREIKTRLIELRALEKSALDILMGNG
jgi:hypothetical protein